MSSSARVDSTCSVPWRSETRQLMRRSRSPEWKARIEENSDPSPSRRERWAPISPIGWGASPTDRSVVEGRQHEHLAAGQARPDPIGSPPTGDVSPTFSAPIIRLPQRRGDSSTGRSAPTR